MKKLLLSVGLLLSMVAMNANAQLRYIEGQDYKVLKNPLPLNQPGQKEVVEIFSYTCPHCYNLEPVIMHWVADKKPKDVGFYQIHATGGSWTFPARVKYVAHKLGLGSEFDKMYFDEIHKKRNRRLAGDKDTAIAFIAKAAGVDNATVEKTWNSLHVKSALKNADKYFAQSELQGVPAVVVNGEYVVQLTEYNRFFDVIEFLLETKDVEPVAAEKTSSTETVTEAVVNAEQPAAAQ